MRRGKLPLTHPELYHSLALLSTLNTAVKKEMKIILYFGQKLLKNTFNTPKSLLTK